MKMNTKTEKVVKVGLGLLIVGVLLISGCGGGKEAIAPTKDLASPCQCGGWWGDDNLNVSWDGQSESVNSINDIVNLGVISPSTGITIDANYSCNGNCEATYEWLITSTPGTETFIGPSPLIYSPGTGWQEGDYYVSVKAFCDTNYCSLYHFEVYVETIQEECGCGGWEEMEASWCGLKVGPQGTASLNECEDMSWSGASGQTIELHSYVTEPIEVTSSINCTSACEAGPNYGWDVWGPNNFHEDENSGGLPVVFTPPEPGIYLVVLNASCDGEECLHCALTMDVYLFGPSFMPAEVSFSGSEDPAKALELTVLKQYQETLGVEFGLTPEMVAVDSLVEDDHTILAIHAPVIRFISPVNEDQGALLSGIDMMRIDKKGGVVSHTLGFLRVEGISSESISEVVLMLPSSSPDLVIVDEHGKVLAHPHFVIYDTDEDADTPAPKFKASFSLHGGLYVDLHWNTGERPRGGCFWLPWPPWGD